MESEGAGEEDNSRRPPQRGRFKRPRREQPTTMQPQGDSLGADDSSPAEPEHAPAEARLVEAAGGGGENGNVRIQQPAFNPNHQQQQGESIFSDSSNTGDHDATGACPAIDQQLFEEIGQAWADSGYIAVAENDDNNADSNDAMGQQQPSLSIPSPSQPQHSTVMPFTAAAAPAPPVNQAAPAPAANPLQLFEQFLSSWGQIGQPTTTPQTVPPSLIPPFAQPQNAHLFFNSPAFQLPQQSNTNRPPPVHMGPLVAALQHGIQVGHQDTLRVPPPAQGSGPNPEVARALLQAMGHPVSPATPAFANQVQVLHWNNPNMLANLLSSPHFLPAMSQFLQQLSQSEQPPPQVPHPSTPTTNPTSMTALLVQMLQQVITGGRTVQTNNPLGALLSSPPTSASVVNSPFDMRMLVPAFMQMLSVVQPHLHSPQQQQLQQPGVFPFAPAASSIPPLQYASSDPNQFASPADAAFTGPVDDAAEMAAASTGELHETEEVSEPKKRRKYNHEAFPQKLHRLISEASIHEDDRRIVRFTDDGTAFEIVDTQGFEAILPRYFRHGKIASFKRLLHMYDFKKLRGTWNAGTFQHPNFRRDEPDLLTEVRRIDRVGDS